MTEWVASALIVMGAAFQGATGFGFALLVSPWIVLLAPELFPGPLMMCSLLLTSMTILRDGMALDRKNIQYSLIGYFPGLVIASALLIYMEGPYFSYFCGSMIILSALLSYFTFSFEPRPVLVSLAGAFSAILNLTTTIGGPPMLLVWQNLRTQPLRAQLAAFFIGGGVLSITTLISIHRFAWNDFIHGLQQFPWVVLGFLLSFRVARHLDQSSIRPLILTAAAIGGMLILFRA
ncbi:MAG: sulfite exporter TauE/SafE family protein [Magnetococcales bacterium]|nr:sulfite exporter TauE/SafE family protein [Magnetococcales bacterium]